MKSQMYYEYTIHNYLPDTFKWFFKVNHNTFERICYMLSESPDLMPRRFPGGRPTIPLEKKVLMSIRYLVSQETVKELSDRFGVTEHSFLRCKKGVIGAFVNRLLPTFITWPNNQEFDTISDKFNEMAASDFPNIIGALDGTHIEIEAPNENPKAYFNRKQYHSIILQAVCTDDLRFTDINIGWPGRVHDAKVLRNSTLWETGFGKCGNGRNHLLGDGAYPLKEWLLTPYRDNGHLTQQQTLFNRALSSRRQVIERAFGMLKGRCRRLQYINIKSVEQICQTIAAACVLHNICIMERDGLDFNDVVGADDGGNALIQGVQALLENDAQGQLKRIHITNRL